MSLPNIAFIGKAGSGKSTCADILIERFKYERLSFAEPLKVGCGTRDDRGLLQKVGHGMRDLFPDFWVNLAIADMQQRNETERWWDHGMGQPPHFVNDDTRYLNEAEKLKAEGFVIVRVAAPRHTRLDRLRRNGRLQDEAQLDFISETLLDDYDEDYTVHNTEHTPIDHLTDELNYILNEERR